ncbi:MAG: DNA polymerase I, partial [Gemmataceae bacterium]
VELPIDWDGWRLQPMDTARLMTLCKEWGFNSLANQIRALDGDVPDTSAPVPVQEELFPFGANAPAAEPEPAPAVGWNPAYRLIDTPEAFDGLVKELKALPRFAFDTETTSIDPLRADLVGVSLCWEPNVACYVPVRGPLGAKTIDLATLKAKLGPVLADPKIAKVNQNIKYELLALHAAGLDVRGVAGDPMLAHYLLHSGERSHSLDDMSRTLLNHTMIPITDLIGKKKPKQPQMTMDQVPTDKVAEYAAEDADAAWRLTALLEAELDRPENASLKAIYHDIEVPLLGVLTGMERAGVRIDVPYLKQLSVEMGRQIEGLEAEIHALAGRAFNVASLPQLRKVLFDDLKLPVQGRTGTTGEPSTDQESLEKLAGLDLPGAALARKVLEHRQVTKLKGTYVDALPDLVHPRTGRLHTSFNQTVAATGRLSSSDPNLQNIPVRRENGQAVRKAFVPEPGWLLLTADYSQIELRLLAHFCQDPTLCRAFADGRDIHAAVAAQIWGVPEGQVTADQRRMAKTVNFGVIYGMSPAGLAQRLQIPKPDAAAFIKAYFEKYPNVEAYQAKLLKDCREKGYTTTLLGRRRRFDPTAIRPHSSYQNRNAAEREAINMEVQGSAADLIKMAMLDVDRRMTRDGFKARLLLQVHDELVFESPPEELPKLAVMVQEMMTGPVARRLNLRVPLGVGLGCGPNWLEVSDL